MVANLRVVFVLRVVIIGGVHQLVTSLQEEPFFIRPEDYRPHEIPVALNGKPTFFLRVDLQIWAITEVSLERQHMEVDLILSVSWTDNRLTVRPNITSLRSWIPLRKEVDNLWTPTLTFKNCKGCSPVTLESSTGIPVLFDKQTGRLWAQFRRLLRFNCNIDLRFYPMDHQYCKLQINTVEDTTDAIILKHYSKEGPRKFLGNITLAEFAIPNLNTGDCTYSISTYQYPCLEINVRFRRLLGYHLTTSYLPTSFIVILSWISFWLPTDVVPARVALGLTSLLTLATRLDQAQRNLPAVSYAKAIDVWMLACIFMVSMSLLEFAVCSYITRTKGVAEVNKTPVKSMRLPTVIKVHHFSAKPVVMNRVIHEESIVYGNHTDSLISRYRKNARPSREQDEQTFTERFKRFVGNTDELGNQKEGAFFDRISRILFPLCFIIFNIVYWSYYLNATPA